MTALEQTAHLADVPIDIEAELGRESMPLRQVLALAPGSVVKLPRSAGENIVILAGGVVFALLGLAVWKLRRGNSSTSIWPRARGAGRTLESVERLALTPQHSLHVVKIHGRKIVVTTHPQGCSVLLQIDKAGS